MMDDFDFFNDPTHPATNNQSNSQSLNPPSGLISDMNSDSLDSMLAMSPLDTFTFGDSQPAMSPLPLSVVGDSLIHESNNQLSNQSSHLSFDSFTNDISPNLSPNPFIDSPLQRMSNDRTGSIHTMKQQRQLNSMHASPSNQHNSQSGSPQHSIPNSPAGQSASSPMNIPPISNQPISSAINQSRIQQQSIQANSPQQHPMTAPYYARSPSQHPYAGPMPPPPGPITDHAYSPLNASQYAFPRAQPVAGHIPAMVNSFGISMSVPANIPRRPFKGELNTMHGQMAIPPTVSANQQSSPVHPYQSRSYSPQQHPQQFQQHPHPMQQQIPFGARPVKYHRHSMSHASGLHTLEAYSSIPEDSPVHQAAVFPSFAVGHKSPPKKKGLTASASTPSLTTLEKKARRPRTAVKTNQTSETSKKKSRLARKAELARASRKRKKAHLSGLEQEVVRLTTAIAEAEARQAATSYDAQMTDGPEYSQSHMPQLGRLRLDDPVHIDHQSNHLNQPYVMTSSSPQSSRAYKSPVPFIEPRVVSAGSASQSSHEASTEHPAAGFTSTPGDMHGTAAYLLARLRSISHPGMQEKFALFAFAQAPYHLQPPNLPPSNNDVTIVASSTLNQQSTTLSQTGMFWHSLLRGELGIEDAQFDALKRHRDSALALTSQVADLDKQIDDVGAQMSRCCDTLLDIKRSLGSVLGDAQREKLNEWLAKNEWVAHMLTSQMNLVPLDIGSKHGGSSSSMRHSASTASLVNLDEEDDSDDSDSS